MFSVPVSFVTAKEADKGKSIRYQRLRVMPDGTLRFDTWEGLPFSESLEEENIAMAFEKDNGWFDRQVKGLVYEDINHIHVIRDTDQYTLPDMEKLEYRLKNTQDDELLQVDVIEKSI